MSKFNCRKSKYLVLFLILSTNVLFLFQNFTASSFNFLAINRVSNTVGQMLDYNTLNDYDFNNDGVNDTVRCSLQNFVSITDGKTGNELYSWVGPAKTRTTDGGAVHTRAFSGCEIVKINDSKPVIILSNYWNTKYWRAASPQYVIFRSGSRFVARELSVEGFGKYYGVARSIKCSPYPQNLVNMGYREGALCFVAEYTAAYLSRSAILKLELSDDGLNVSAKDLTPTSDLMWREGVRGTSIWGFPVGYGFASNQRDGAFMMDSAFLDFNQDGFIDLMTVGQHAKIRAHKMIVDRARPEGIRFITQNLTNADSRTDMTELLKVTSFDRYDSELDVPCVYLSGEKSPNGFDNIRCFKNEAWIKYTLPNSFFSEYYNARIRLSVQGDAVIIKSRLRREDGSIVDFTFVVRP